MLRIIKDSTAFEHSFKPQTDLIITVLMFLNLYDYLTKNWLLLHTVLTLRVDKVTVINNNNLFTHKHEIRKLVTRTKLKSQQTKRVFFLTW